jgi:hypothetical protein
LIARLPPPADYIWGSQLFELTLTPLQELVDDTFQGRSLSRLPFEHLKLSSLVMTSASTVNLLDLAASAPSFVVVAAHQITVLCKPDISGEANNV